MPRGWFGPKPAWWKKKVSDKLTDKSKSDDHKTAIGDGRRGKKFPRKKDEKDEDKPKS